MEGAKFGGVRASKWSRSWTLSPCPVLVEAKPCHAILHLPVSYARARFVAGMKIFFLRGLDPSDLPEVTRNVAVPGTPLTARAVPARWHAGRCRLLGPGGLGRRGKETSTSHGMTVDQAGVPGRPDSPRNPDAHRRESLMPPTVFS